MSSDGIYLNAGSHGLPSAATRARMMRHLALEAEIGPFAAAQTVAEELTAGRAAMARLIGAEGDPVGVAATTFTAWRWLVETMELRGDGSARRILVAPLEWGDNVRHLRMIARRSGLRLETLPPLENGDVGAWTGRIDGDVAAIFAPLVSSLAGHRLPLEGLGAAPRPEGCRFVVDAAQALGQTPIDVGALNCDALTATTRKWLRGPRGTAMFWIRPGGRPGGEGISARDLESSDQNVALLLGQGVAAREAAARGVAEINATVWALRERLREGLDGVRGLRVIPQLRSAPSDRGTGFLACLVEPEARAGIEAALSELGATAKWPPAVRDEPLSDLDLGGRALLRFAPHVYTAEEDVDAVAAALRAVV